MSAPPVDVLREALKDVFDPELGCNIIDLGLVYDIAVDGADVTITMSMTTPGCPAQAAITNGVEQCLSAQEGVGMIAVNVVWEPRWSPQRMSTEAKLELGVSL